MHQYCCTHTFDNNNFDTLNIKVFFFFRCKGSPDIFVLLFYLSNIPQADERHRIVTRKEVSLFDANAYREAIINAFVHNNWKGNVAPIFTFYSDRIEILSHGALSPKLTIKDFYKGKSEPTNKKLSDIFVQLHISERMGRGVPTILNSYCENLLNSQITGFK